MQVESRPVARIWTIEITPALFRKSALAAASALYVVVTSGAVVRLTASGLGCDNWPRCGDTPFPEKGGHAFIEFSNRVVAVLTLGFTLVSWLVARKVRGLPRWVSRLALVVFLGTFAQIPLGGLTVLFELHPLLVMSHFLLALLMLAAATVVVLEARGFEAGRTASLVPAFVRWLGLVLALACLALVVTGTFTTAAGPHSGGTDIRRLGTLTGALYIHVRATAVFGLALLGLSGWLASRRDETRLLFRGALGLLGLVLVQMALGEIQYRERLPWGLVLAHVALAAAIWVWTVALVALLYRPLAVLAPRRA